MYYGARVNGRLEAITTSLGLSQDMSKSGEIYQIDIETTGMVDEEATISQLFQLESQIQDLRIVYIETNHKTNVITMQFTDIGPGSFSFIGLLGALPLLLGVIFIGVIALTLWMIYSSNPLLLWALLVLGAGVAFFFFTSGKITAPTKSIYTKEKSLEERDQKLKESRLDYLETKLVQEKAQREQDKAEKERKEAETKLEADMKAKEKAEKDLKKAKKKAKEKPEVMIV